MTAAVLLALAAQVVTLRPADIETKAAYVRVGVGVESRLTLPEPAVRVRGQQSAKELLGLRLGQVRPKGVLLIRPREAGTARLLFEGATHRIRLDIEASALGAAQDVEFRIGEPVVAAATPAPQKPTPAPTPKAAPVPAPQQKREAAAASPRQPEAKPTPATTRPADRKPAAGDPAKAAPKPLVAAGAPTPAPTPALAQGTVPIPIPSAVAAAPSPSPGAASERPAGQQTADTSAAPRPAATPSATPAKRQVAKIGRYVGMPGQRGVWVDELARDGAHVSLRLRVEGGAGAVEVTALEIEGAQATVRTEVAGKDLVVIGEVPVPAQKPRQATLAMAERGRFRKEKLKLVGPGLADLVFDGGRAW